MAALRFEICAHFSGAVDGRPRVMERVPWVYTIADLAARLLYVGETMSASGLIGRLSEHFGRGQNATFKKRASALAGIIDPQGPFMVFAARLPHGEENAPFDGGSSLVRTSVETYVQDFLIKDFVSCNRGWQVISSCTSQPSNNPAIPESANSIFRLIEGALGVLGPLSSSSPLQILLLAPSSEKRQDELPLEELLCRFEVLLHNWIINAAKVAYSDSWWTQGIPTQVRVSCSTRREEEALELPVEAYMTLIDLRKTIQHGWPVFGPAMEAISKCKGKQRATEWMVELNDLRKIHAHPVKAKYQIPPADRVARIRVHFEAFVAHVNPS